MKPLPLLLAFVLSVVPCVVSAQTAIIHYTFDSDGSNSGSDGSTNNLTLSGSASITSLQVEVGSGALDIPSGHYARNTSIGGDLSTLDPGAGATAFTVAGFIRLDGFAIANQQMFGLGDGNINSGIRGRIDSAGTVAILWQTAGGIAGGTSSIPSIDWSDGFHHLAFVGADSGSGTTSQVDIYIDGSFFQSFDSSNQAFQLGTLSNLTLGMTTSLQEGLDGQLDDFRIYDVALNSSQIATLAAAAVPEPSTYAALLGICALGLAMWRRRAQRR